MRRPDDDRPPEPAEPTGATGPPEPAGATGPPEPACGVASGGSLEGARSGESLAAGSRGVTAGFTDGADVPVRPADVGEPATDRTCVAALPIPPVRGDASVGGGHRSVAVGDLQDRDS